MATQMLE